MIKLSEIKTTKGVFRYCVIAERGRGSVKGLLMIMGEEVGGWSYDDISK